VNSAAFAILHLLPVDIATSYNLADIVLHYQTVLLANVSNQTFTDDVTIFTFSRASANVVVMFFFFVSLFLSQVIFALQEWESVEYLREYLPSSFLSSISLDYDRHRQFQYHLIGRQCNYTWATLKIVNTTNSSLTNVDAALSLCVQINYPFSDTISVDDGGLFA
jgi:hypothetical protein